MSLTPNVGTNATVTAGDAGNGMPRVRSSGLGLTFCKLAVEAHGGRIGVESTVGSGGTFRVTPPDRPLPA